MVCNPLYSKSPCSHMTEMSQSRSGYLVVHLCEESLCQNKPKIPKVMGEMTDYPEGPQNTSVSGV